MYHDQIDTMLADEPDAVVKELIIAENIMVNSDINCSQMLNTG